MAKKKKCALITGKFAKFAYRRPHLGLSHTGGDSKYGGKRRRWATAQAERQIHATNVYADTCRWATAQAERQIHATNVYTCTLETHTHAHPRARVRTHTHTHTHTHAHTHAHTHTHTQSCSACAVPQTTNSRDARTNRQNGFSESSD